MIPDSSTREAAIRLRCLLCCLDTHMSNRCDAQRGWIEISIALGLASTQGKTLTEIASEHGVTKQALSRPVTTFLRMSQLQSPFGLKSEAARIKYQASNGRRSPE
jgi:hypothetical protein